MTIKRNFYVKNDTLIFDMKEEKSIVENYTFNESGRLVIHSRPNTYVNIEHWNDTVNGAFPMNTEIKNHDFKFLFAENAKDKNSVEHDFVTPSFSTNSEFNYYSDYLVELEGEDEKNLMSFYLFYKNKENQKYENMSALPTIKQLSKGMFSNFSYNYFDLYRTKSTKDLDMMSNTLFGTDYNLTKNFNKKNDFPLYSEITFSYEDDISLLKNNLDKNNLLEHFICNVLYTSLIPSKKFVDDNMTTDIRYVPLLTVIDNFKNHSGDKVILSNKDMKDVSNLSFVNRSIMTSEVVKMMPHHRSYQQILDNKDSKTEVVFFRVDKYAESLSGKPVQTYHFPATADSIKLLDTQIFHDKQYHYVVNAYVLVYGTSYSYNLEDSYLEVGTGVYKSEISIDTKSDFRIYELELFRTSAIVTQTPPNVPYARFVNTSNQKNQIFFRIDQDFGRTEQKFHVVDPIDELQKDMMKQSVTDGEKFKFQKTKSQLTYQIFRVSEKPKGYSDFKENLLEEVDTKVNQNILISSDFVMPNKKYYYIFRAVNTTGKVSNPSPIYEVELIKNSGESRIDVKVHKTKAPQKAKKVTAIKQLLHIAPASDQRFLNPESSIIADASTYDELHNYINLAENSENPVWNRKFKFRIKSKATGKIIDFNVKFKLKKVRNVEDLS